MASIVENIKYLRDDIAKIAKASQSNKQSNNQTESPAVSTQEIVFPKIMAVSKTYALEAVNEAVLGGICLFGENKIQELQSKFYANSPDTGALTSVPLKSQIELHYIGTLQRNKVAKAVDMCNCIESVDSVGLIDEIEKIVARRQSGQIVAQGSMGQRDLQEQFAAQETSLESQQGAQKFSVYLQVRCSDYDFKHGFDNYDALREAADRVCKSECLALRGIMTIGPFSDEEKTVRTAFACAKKWHEGIMQEYSLEELELSMGMSHDYRLAIKEGSTLLRVGTAIFGARVYT